MTRIRVGILFGGESGEHDVSVASATSVVQALDPALYEPVLIGITRAGQWVTAESADRLLRDPSGSAIAPGDPVEPEVPGASLLPLSPIGVPALGAVSIDVVFPVMHGPRGEDGTVQGLLDLAGIPYVGSGVLASAVSMDKAMMKAVFAAAGLPGVAYQLVLCQQWEHDANTAIQSIEEALSYPVFVKPCNMGSSVGISRARNRDELRGAVTLAARFDRRVIVEQGVNAREIECAVLGNEEPAVSVPGEIISHHAFYDYEAKYTDGMADLLIPADLSPTQTRTVQDLAARAFAAVDGAGLARVDFFVLRESGDVLVNELNTIPGFTATSMFPRLWKASGVSYSELLHRLIQLAVERHGAIKRLRQTQ